MTRSDHLLSVSMMELLSILWIVIVALQYIGNYFLGMDVNFIWAYLVMLGLIAVAAVLRIMRAISPLEQNQVQDKTGISSKKIVPRHSPKSRHRRR